jgi:hypothetical protein
MRGICGVESYPDIISDIRSDEIPMRSPWLWPKKEKNQELYSSDYIDISCPLDVVGG